MLPVRELVESPDQRLVHTRIVRFIQPGEEALPEVEVLKGLVPIGGADTQHFTRVTPSEREQEHGRTGVDRGSEAVEGRIELRQRVVEDALRYVVREPEPAGKAVDEEMPGFQKKATETLPAEESDEALDSVLIHGTLALPPR